MILRSRLGPERTAVSELTDSTSRIRQTAIAAAAVVASVAAAIASVSLLLLDPASTVHGVITATVPRPYGLEPRAAAALVPALLVSVGVLAAVLSESKRQLVAVRATRVALEEHATEESETSEPSASGDLP